MYKQIGIKERAGIVYQITKVKIDEATIFIRTQETLREYISVLIQNKSLHSSVNMKLIYTQLPGMYTAKQLKQLYSHTNESTELMLSYDYVAKTDDSSYALSLEVETLIKLLWSYLVYCSQRVKSGQREAIDYALISSGKFAFFLILG